MQYRNSNLFFRAFAILAFIGVADYINNKFYYYWTVSGLDKPMHLLGGACVGMGTIWLVSCLYSEIENSQKKVIIIGVLGTLLIGILWEIFELHFGITTLSDGWLYYKDTMGDLSMDLLGGLLASLYSWKLIK